MGKISAGGGATLPAGRSSRDHPPYNSAAVVHPDSLFHLSSDPCWAAGGRSVQGMRSTTSFGGHSGLECAESPPGSRGRVGLLCMHKGSGNFLSCPAGCPPPTHSAGTGCGVRPLPGPGTAGPPISHPTRVPSRPRDGVDRMRPGDIGTQKVLGYPKVRVPPMQDPAADRVRCPAEPETSPCLQRGHLCRFTGPMGRCRPNPAPKMCPALCPPGLSNASRTGGSSPPGVPVCR